MTAVQVTGGGQLRRIIYRSQQLTGERLAQFAAEVLRDELLPALRARVPHRTGKLRNSLTIRVQRQTVELRGTFYAEAVRWNDGRDSVARIAMEIYDKRQRVIADRIVEKVRQFLGV